ncbi:hypothetical protein KC317_g18378 [Hortaea werneckii]|nr:hypothetical protein KC317_g18378 [Hortaea werneckii]KAI7579877.1 hypothetical protein KC346_g19083 [Hortaea werneckii]KAI7647229.1 hypothetical protein KC322_g19294 [Hortaea werneckii]
MTTFCSERPWARRSAFEDTQTILRAPNFVPIPAPCNGCTHDNGGKQALGYRNNHATSVVCNGCNFLQSSGGS